MTTLVDDRHALAGLLEALARATTPEEPDWDAATWWAEVERRRFHGERSLELILRRVILDVLLRLLPTALRDLDILGELAAPVPVRKAAPVDEDEAEESDEDDEGPPLPRAVARPVVKQLSASEVAALLARLRQPLVQALETALMAGLPAVLDAGRRQAEADLRDRPHVLRVSTRAAKPKPLVQILFDLVDAALGAYLWARPREYAPTIAESTLDLLRSALIEASEEGLGTEAIARRLVEETAPQISRQRARVIARTEVVSASNLGAFSTYRASGLVRWKQWIYTRDARTRDDHRYRGVVPLDEPFELPESGARLMYPGDTSLGAPLETIINCRCTLRAHAGPG